MGMFKKSLLVFCGSTATSFNRYKLRNPWLIGFVNKMCSTGGKYVTREHGSKYSMDYSVYIYDNCLKSAVSPFHDIPLFVDEQNYVLNMVVEVPRWSNAKFEINKKAELNPIKQDVKNGKPRFIHNIFPFHGYPWNYGAIPKTWEDPNYVDPHTNTKGDSDPVDVLDIGSAILNTGDVVAVKVIGCVALIDEGETDWKVIAINTKDPRATKISCLKTLEEECPGVLDMTIKWLRYYKVPTGAAPNKFAFEGVFFKDRDFTMQIIRHSHEDWKKLVAAGSSSFSLLGTTDPSSKHYLDVSAADAILSKCQPTESSAIPSEVNNVHYLKLN